MGIYMRGNLPAYLITLHIHLHTAVSLNVRLTFMLMVDHIYLEYTDEELNQMEEDASTMEALFHLQNINCKKRQRLAKTEPALPA